MHGAEKEWRGHSAFYDWVWVWISALGHDWTSSKKLKITLALDRWKGEKARHKPARGGMPRPEAAAGPQALQATYHHYTPNVFPRAKNRLTSESRKKLLLKSAKNAQLVASGELSRAPAYLI